MGIHFLSSTTLEVKTLMTVRLVWTIGRLLKKVQKYFKIIDEQEFCKKKSFTPKFDAI